jgi:hypothetical protein
MKRIEKREKREGKKRAGAGIALLTFLLSHLLTLCLHAASPGSTAAAFLKIGVGGRNIGMGETGSVSRDINSIYWNPAGLVNIQKKEVSLMHALWFEDISYEQVAYGMPTKYGTFAVGLNYLWMTGIDKWDMYDQPLNESYRPYDAVGILGYARTIKGIPVGMNLKYIYSKIDTEHASAVAVDIGGVYDDLSVLGKKMKIGLVVQNLGTKMKFIDEGDALPVNIKVGCSYDFIARKKEQFEAGVDVNIPVDNDVRVNLGTEYMREIGKNMSAAIRAGYRTNTKGLGAISGLTAGLGFQYYDYSIDYAWVPFYGKGDFGNLGDTHRISLGLKF